MVGTELAETDASTQDELRKAGKEAVALADEILDEIDTILEENAEDFVAGYVQKGGE